MTTYQQSIIPKKDRPCKMDQVRQLLPPEVDALLLEVAANPNSRISDIQDVLTPYNITVQPQAISFWRKREYRSGILANKINEEVQDYKGIDDIGILDKLIHDSMMNLGVLRDKMEQALADDSISPTEILRAMPGYEKNLVLAIESKGKIQQEAMAKDYTLAGAMWMGQFLIDSAARDNPNLLEFLHEVISLGLMAIKSDRIA